MKINEVISPSYRKHYIAEDGKTLGRAFNHLEDLVFFYGSEGTLEALQHLRDVATEQGAKSIRMKWDGSPQVYWGRETKGGPLVFAGHNGWLRGAKTDNPADVADFISNKSGSPKSDEEKAQRDAFAQEFANLYPLFDKATPKDFVGFVYADSLFLQRPQVDAQGVYTFCPNPKSQTCYHVRKDSDLGNRITRAKVMVVGHAFFPQFGMPDASQQPISDFSQFNSNADLIVLGPVYNSKPVKINLSSIQKVESFLQGRASAIDQFLASVKGLGDLKDIIYKFVNQTAKAKKLDQLSDKLFAQWLESSSVSDGKKAKIAELNSANNNALSVIFQLVRMIQDMKDNVIAQVEGEQGDIWDTNGEGRVRYGDQNKKFGNVKFVPRKTWTP